MLDWIKNHFNLLHNLQLNTIVTDKNGKEIPLEEGFHCYIEMVTAAQAHNKLMFIGNGGSAGIASHLAIDYSKNGKLSAMTFTDGAALTCLSNDYGYEYVFAKQIEFHARKGDVLIAISSSGCSPNILSAVKTAIPIVKQIITFSGFGVTNPLRQIGDLNFYIASKKYSLVEVSHLSLCHAMLDYIIEKQNHFVENPRPVLLSI